MPTYEYECQKCGKRFEAFQSITETPLKDCIYCKGKVRRLIGPGSGFIFKGNGFYATDYRKSDPKEKKDKQTPPPCPAKGDCSACPRGG